MLIKDRTLGELEGNYSGVTAKGSSDLQNQACVAHYLCSSGQFLAYQQGRPIFPNKSHQEIETSLQQVSREEAWPVCLG